MKHLSGLDATFLHIESPEMPMHIASLDVLELPEGYSGDFYEDAKAHIASRMHLAPLFTRKLALMPFELADPVWVDDEDIDLEYHVRRIILPRPGTWQQLEKYVARLHSSLLDRSRPLWEFYVIEGLEGGHMALYAKVHHAGVDGQAGVAVARALMDLEPAGRIVKPPRPKPRTNQYQLGIAELAGAAVSNAVRQYVQLVKSVPEVARVLKGAVVPRRDEDGKRRWLPKDFKVFGPKTPFNVAITNQRSWAARQVPLGEVKQAARLLGVTLNDVVLATCSGALRRYLHDHDALPAKTMNAAIPVSLRAEGNTDANNQVSFTLMTLATDVKDPMARLRAIQKSSHAAKQMIGGVKGVIPTDFPILGSPWLMSGLASMVGRSRLANVIPPVANVMISNVPGPNVPLYFAGAKMTTYYPVSIPAHGVALNITVQSYNGALFFGLIACRRAVPDLADLADYMVAEHAALMKLAQSQAEVVEVQAPAPALEAAPKPATPRKTQAARAAKLAKAAIDSAKQPAADKPARRRKAAAAG